MGYRQVLREAPDFIDNFEWLICDENQPLGDGWPMAALAELRAFAVTNMQSC